MPLYLDTRGNSQVAIAICDRCKLKFPIGELSADRNSPGLRVCKADNDRFDPWRLPARKTEDITLRYPRPDVPIDGFVAGAPDDILTEEYEELYTEFGEVLMTEEY